MGWGEDHNDSEIKQEVRSDLEHQLHVRGGNLNAIIHDYRDRLYAADVRLRDLALRTLDEEESARLLAKAEGVQLAISYLEEL